MDYLLKTRHTNKHLLESLGRMQQHAVCNLQLNRAPYAATQKRIVPDDRKNANCKLIKRSDLWELTVGR